MSSAYFIDALGKALIQLDRALVSPAGSDLERAGCIQYFEFCFELAWKAVKSVAAELGLPECSSPKACLRTAFAQGWISEEGSWLAMLEARNRMTHTYSIDDAVRIYDSLALYLRNMQNLHGALQQGGQQG